MRDKKERRWEEEERKIAIKERNGRQGVEDERKGRRDAGWND